VDVTIPSAAKKAASDGTDARRPIEQADMSAMSLA
jgi:hypothetical protein